MYSSLQQHNRPFITTLLEPESSSSVFKQCVEVIHRGSYLPCLTLDVKLLQHLSERLDRLCNDIQ